MEAFSPLPALVGGALIGLASAVLWLGNGRIAGVSGIFGQLLPPASTVVWRLVFLIALVGGALAAAYLLPGLGVGGPGGRPAALATPPAWFTGGAPLWIVASGLLTGFGTKIGNGCTSGHGVCGIARLSKRSFVAVGIFFAVAILTVTLTGIV
ncbi:MAG: YeeE/YedE family protein [Devosia sp.]